MKTILGYTLQPVRPDHIAALHMARSVFMEASPEPTFTEILLAAKILGSDKPMDTMHKDIRLTWRDRWQLFRRGRNAQHLKWCAVAIILHLRPIFKQGVLIQEQKA